jgi:threonine synthase
MKSVFESSGELLDPHTAIGVGAALQEARNSSGPGDAPVVVLATAHPAKFPDAVERATGVRPPLPEFLDDLYQRPERFEVLPNDLQAVQRYIAERIDLH